VNAARVKLSDEGVPTWLKSIGDDHAIRINQFDQNKIFLGMVGEYRPFEDDDILFDVDAPDQSISPNGQIDHLP